MVRKSVERSFSRFRNSENLEVLLRHGLSFRRFENSRNVEVSLSAAYQAPQSQGVTIQKTTAKMCLSYPGDIARMPAILEVAVIIVRATADHEHDHGGFPEHEARARPFAFFSLSALIIHPCFNAPPSPQLA